MFRTPIVLSFGSRGRTHYTGPERRADTARVPHWLAATLDEIDYGMLLLQAGPQLIHMNHAARAELDGMHPLQLLAGELRARSPHDAGALADALRAASVRGLRRLLTLGEGERRVSVSVVPLPGDHEADLGPVVLVILGKRQVCEGLSVQGFSRCHGLTAAEMRVLAALCEGMPPAQIAAHLGVAISTVRTQIGAIRTKTGAESIRDLVRQVAVLPPLMGVLRGAVELAGDPVHGLLCRSA